MTSGQEDEAALLARLADARKVLRRAVEEAGFEPSLAATACAELAGEYAALLAAERDLPPGPVLDEVAQVLRRHGAGVHHVLQPGEMVGHARASHRSGPR
jgi:hypothetical protein